MQPLGKVILRGIHNRRTIGLSRVTTLISARHCGRQTGSSEKAYVGF